MAITVAASITTAQAANAAPNDAASASQPAASGPVIDPASEAIWKTATTLPPRPLMMSPTTAPGAVPTKAPPTPIADIASRYKRQCRRDREQPERDTRCDRPGDHGRPAAAPVDKATGHRQERRLEEGRAEEAHADPDGAGVQRLGHEQRDQAGPDAEESPADREVHGTTAAR